MRTTIPTGGVWVDLDRSTRMNVNRGGADMIQLEFWEPGDHVGQLTIQGRCEDLTKFARVILDFVASAEAGE